ncbi:MAG: hypothetical protein P1V35_10385 [Planctomycetota bacterium]|nr:hypothetical protein [Planctomycetota bacterium]
MKNPSVIIPIPVRYALIVFLACASFGSDPVDENDPVESTQEDVVATFTPLELAFRAASALPEVPHIKTRCRLQEQVALAYLQQGKATQAKACIDQISNWRRGVGYADIAQFHIDNGYAEKAEGFVKLALEICDQPRSDSDQAWRRGRILGKAAAAMIDLGRAEEAQVLAAGLESVEVSPVHMAQLRKLKLEDKGQLLARLRRAVASGQFEEQRASLTAVCEFQERHYGHPGVLRELEQAIRDSWGKMPAQVRLGLILNLGQTAQKNGELKDAIRLLQDGENFMGGLDWRIEDEMPWVGVYAELRAASGDAAGAKESLRRAMLRYIAGEKEIVNIYRSRSLRPLAEAHMGLGNLELASEIYAQALEAGWVNRNSRPRAEDLVGTICSMASSGFVPDAKMQKRLETLANSLGSPW